MNASRRQQIVDVSTIGMVAIALGLAALIRSGGEPSGKYALACGVVAGIGVLVHVGHRISPARLARGPVRGSIGVIVVGAVIAIAPLLRESGNPGFGIPLVLVATVILLVSLARPADSIGQPS